MKNSFQQFSLLLSLFLLFTSCKTNLLVLEDVVPSARFQDLEIKFQQLDFQDLSLKLTLLYKVRNPYNKALPIPEHRMGLAINDTDKPITVKKSSSSIPPNSTKTLAYDFSLNPQFIKNIWGKKNKLTFFSDIKIDLDDFSQFLPNFELGLTENFELESDQLKPLASKLLKRKIGSHTISLSHDTFLKIPTPPSISPSNETIQLNWLGETEEILAINAIKDGLTPFGDLLINGSIDNLKNPFVDALVNTAVTIPSPRLSCWNCSTEIGISDRVVDLVKPFDPNIQNKWNNLKGLLYQEQSVSLAEYMIENFITTYVDPNASTKWDRFKSQWETFKSTSFPANIPGPNTKGFEITIPIAFTNNNEFPINLPLFRTSAFAFNSEPFSMHIRPKGLAEISLTKVPIQHIEIGQKETKTLYITFSFNMEAFENGIFSLFDATPMSPNVRGVMSYDFGYGPIYWNYDLSNMALQYNE